MSAPLLCRLTSQVEPLSHKRRENLVDFPGNDYMDFKEDIVTFIRLIDNWSSIDNYCFFQWERKEEGDLNKPWIYSIAYSRVHKEDGFKARRAYLWGWSLSAEFHVTNNETPFLQTQPCATDKRFTLTVFFLAMKILLIPNDGTFLKYVQRGW